MIKRYSRSVLSLFWLSPPVQIDMSITINDIAKGSGVSVSTVSAVLNNRHTKIRVSERTRQRVREVANRLNYRPSFSARSLVRGKTFSLGLICGDIHTPFFSELTSIAMEESEARGYHLLVAVTRWDPRKELECLDTLLQRKVDGLFTVSTSLQPGTSQYEYIVDNKIPFVGLQPSLPGLSVVNSNWQTGMNEAVGRLKAGGFDRIGFVNLPKTDYEDKECVSKQTAFLEACRLSKITPLVYECAIDLEKNRRIGRELIDRPDPLRAFIVGSDFMAMGIIRGFRDRGLDVPRDLAVIGMDGTAIGGFYHPPLTTIAQDIRQTVTRALDLILTMIDRQELIEEKILIPTKLIVRESA
jgi:LacI family transcriptional regulator